MPIGELTPDAVYWRCRHGHVTPVRLSMLDCDGTDVAVGGSAWDLCDRCGESPSPADDVRMPLQIFGQWLRAGTIDHDQYRAFAAGVVSPTCVIHFCQRPTHPASSVCAPCQEETKRLWENRKLREKLR